MSECGHIKLEESAGLPDPGKVASEDALCYGLQPRTVCTICKDCNICNTSRSANTRTTRRTFHFLSRYPGSLLHQSVFWWIPHKRSWWDRFGNSPLRTAEPPRFGCPPKLWKWHGFMLHHSTDFCSAKPHDSLRRVNETNHQLKNVRGNVPQLHLMSPRLHHTGWREKRKLSFRSNRPIWLCILLTAKQKMEEMTGCRQNPSVSREPIPLNNQGHVAEPTLQEGAGATCQNKRLVCWNTKVHLILTSFLKLFMVLTTLDSL